MAARRQKLQFELDGPGADPDQVDSLALLQLAESWFRLTAKVAEAFRIGLSFRGLKVIDKCVAVAVSPSDLASARTATAHVVRIVSVQEDLPRGTEVAVEDFRRALRALPAAQLANVRVGAWTRRVRPPRPQEAEHPWERTELRVSPIRVGGASPTATLFSTSELAPFTATLSRVHARQLGAALYGEADVELEICRDMDGRIERGRILSVHVVVGTLDADSEIAQWREWRDSIAADWEDVENVGEELGRG